MIEGARENVVANGTKKRAKKGCDWIVANDVSPHTGVFSGDANQVHLIFGDGVEDWPRMTKTAVAESLAQRVADTLTSGS